MRPQPVSYGPCRLHQSPKHAARRERVRFSPSPASTSSTPVNTITNCLRGAGCRAGFQPTGMRRNPMCVAS